MATPQLYTYHCICNELVAAICGTLQERPKRTKDKAAICSISTSAAASESSVTLSRSTQFEADAAVIKLEDGFEKRYAVRCGRCDVQIGYMLDKASFEDGSSGMKNDVVYLLPGGLMSTDEMREGKDMSEEVELVAGAAG